MKKLIKKIIYRFDYENFIKEMIVKNKKEVEAYNYKVFNTLLVIGGILLLVGISYVPFSEEKLVLAPFYLSLLGLLYLLKVVFKISVMEKYAWVGLYIIFTMFFSLAINLSIIQSPNMRATMLLVGFILLPLSFIDRPSRVTYFSFFWFFLHTTLSFYYKPLYALDDMVNCICVIILGKYFGNSIAKLRLESIDTTRKLVIEKHTDLLTEINSRRKLSEKLDELKSDSSMNPTGTLMIDIDHFKKYNDDYGHVVGDECLKQFGKILITFSKKHRIEFYRYGGEEFLAFAYGYTKDELYRIGEELRIQVESSEILGRMITISMGISYCGDNVNVDYGSEIGLADDAAYVAKRAGRNQVFMKGMRKDILQKDIYC